jgi:signal transduction histidine kinase
VENIGEEVKPMDHDLIQPESPQVPVADWWWLPAALRGVTIALSLFVSLLTDADGLVRVVLPLAVLAAWATVLDQRRLPPSWQQVVEAASAGLIVGSAGDLAFVGQSYIVVPGFVAGLVAGIGWALLGTVVTCLAYVAGLLMNPPPSETVATIVGAAQWGALAFVLALLGGWGHRARKAWSSEDVAYREASRLLDDLRSLSPHLTAGLDATQLAESLLDDVDAVLPTRRTAVVVRSASGIRVVASRRADDSWLDSLEQDAWPGGQGNSTENSEERVVIPPRHEADEWVVLDDADRRAVRAIETIVSQHTLRLKTAQAFAEVSALAALEERQRIAREIHDGIAQDVASLAFEVDHLALESPEDVSSTLGGIAGRLRHLVRDLRLSIFDLRDQRSRDTSVLVSVPEHARRNAAAAGLELRLTVRDSEANLPPGVERELVRIAQEAITNVRKHARARTIWVEVLHQPNRCVITVRDDGVGFAATRRAPGADHGHGLEIMYERARAVGARLDVTPRLGGGTVVRVEFGGPA